MTFIKKALLLHKMRLMHKDVQKYHLSTTIGMHLEQGGQGLLTDNTEHLQSCEAWTPVLILLQNVPMWISHLEGGANAIIIKQNVSFLLMSFLVAISDFIYKLNLITLCKLWPLVHISKEKNMFNLMLAKIFCGCCSWWAQIAKVILWTKGKEFQPLLTILNLKDYIVPIFSSTGEGKNLKKTEADSITSMECHQSLKKGRFPSNINRLSLQRIYTLPHVSG